MRLPPNDGLAVYPRPAAEPKKSAEGKPKQKRRRRPTENDEE